MFWAGSGVTGSKKSIIRKKMIIDFNDFMFNTVKILYVIICHFLIYFPFAST